MNIRIQVLSKNEINDLRHFRIEGKLNYCYIVLFENTGIITEDTLGNILKQLEISKLYFYMQIDDCLQSNIIDYCKKKSLKLQFLNKINQYHFAQILIESTKNIIDVIDIIELLTGQMEDLTLFTTKEIVTIDTQFRKNGLFEIFPVNIDLTDEATIMVPDDSGVSFVLYSNDKKFLPESLLGRSLGISIEIL